MKLGWQQDIDHDFMVIVHCLEEAKLLIKDLRNALRSPDLTEELIDVKAQLRKEQILRANEVKHLTQEVNHLRLVLDVLRASKSQKKLKLAS